MYTRSYRSFRTLFHAFRRYLFWYVIYVGVIYYAYTYLHIEALDIKMSIATVLGFAVALLLAFRTSASYERWWEARKIWGGIVNDSRTLIRQVINFTDPINPIAEARQLAYYQMAWCHSLKNGLREIDPLEGLNSYLTPEDLAQLKGINNIPNHLLMLMEKVLFQLRETGQLDPYQFVTVDQTLKNLCDHMGKCERINNTVFPIQYHSYTYRGIVIFTLMLPYGMLFSTGPFVILICTIVAFIFLMLDQIAVFLQDPFNNTKSDIPMSALSRTIEINLRQMIGDKNIPEPLKPDKNGILM